MLNTDIIDAEMLTHVALCTHREPKDILILGDNDYINHEIARHVNNRVDHCNNTSCIKSTKDNSFDVIIVNSNKFYQPDFVTQANRVLRNNGLIVLKSIDDIKIPLTNFGSLFDIVMMYGFQERKAIMATKKYHPTADLILDRADLIENLSYYNADIHIASFALPTNLKKELLGIQKN
ncbi:MAG: spermidine synthase [Sulfurospirillum sp.]|nr:spermidine synthase [Sulfurospirillum sp.]